MCPYTRVYVHSAQPARRAVVPRQSSTHRRSWPCRGFWLLGESGGDSPHVALVGHREGSMLCAWLCMPVALPAGLLGETGRAHVPLWGPLSFISGPQVCPSVSPGWRLVASLLSSRYSLTVCVLKGPPCEGALSWPHRGAGATGPAVLQEELSQGACGPHLWWTALGDGVSRAVRWGSLH